eukprot:495588_1
MSYGPSYTFVADNDYNIYIGNYKRTRPIGNQYSAHYRLGDQVGIYSGCGGAYYSKYNFPVYNSGTFNLHGKYGRYNIYGTPEANIIGNKFDNGDYYRAYNMGGGMGRVWYNEYTDDIQIRY